MNKAVKEETVVFRRAPGSPLTQGQRDGLAALAKIRDEDIDYSDIPETTAEMWKDAVRGKFYKPVKRAVSLRLDADVIAWLKKEGAGYQTRANKILREQMLREIG